MKHVLTGILPVAPTPFTADGRVDEEGMRRVLDCMIDQGVDAICILANYSEQFVLSDEERALLTKLSVEHVAGRVPVIVTISHFATNIVVERAKYAQSLGASMVMMMPPYHCGMVPAPPARHLRAFQGRVGRDLDPDHDPGCPDLGCITPRRHAGQDGEGDRERSYFKIEVPFAADKLAALIEAGGPEIVGPFDGEEAVTLLADLDAGATGTMTSAMFPEKIRPIVIDYRAGRVDARWRSGSAACRLSTMRTASAACALPRR